MTHIIAIANHKWGVGKTTSVQNIGSALSLRKHKTLMIDLDPQANLSDAFGYDEEEVCVYDALIGKSILPIVPINEHLYLSPSGLDLSVAEIELSSRTGREHILKRIIEKVKADYDYILIDCPPSLGLLTVNALTACNEIYIPLDAEVYSMKGLGKLMIIVNDVKQLLNQEVDITGVFLTQFNQRLVLHKDIAQKIKDTFPNKVFQTKIRQNIALAEAPLESKSIFDYEPESHGAKDYLNLVEEIIKAHS